MPFKHSGPRRNQRPRRSKPFGSHKVVHRGGNPSTKFRVKRPQKSFSDISKFVNKVVVTEELEVFVPEHAFTDFNVEPILKTNIAAKGYVTPTPIQDKAIPHILHGEDIVGIANTGTGKTAAFLIPLINKVLRNPKEKILIVVPTRELAFQIDEELRGFAKGTGLFSVVVIGGTGMGKQIAELRHLHHFVIGTPGRLKDHLENKHLDLAKFNTVVLDEADRMLDMGFINDMRYMMDKMPKERHTLFFSATLSQEIESLIHSFLRTPARISVKTRDTSASIDQDVVRTNGRPKGEVLLDLLRQPGFDKTLIFARTKHGADRLTKFLNDSGIRAAAIHGNKLQNARQKALKDFKSNATQVLVATDVAARGLDISDVSHVINFDLPATYEDYVHRIGRTGRGGQMGKALTFIE